MLKRRKKKKIPKYYIFRVYFSALLISFMFSFMMIISITIDNLPDVINANFKNIRLEFSDREDINSDEISTEIKKSIHNKNFEERAEEFFSRFETKLGEEYEKSFEYIWVGIILVLIFNLPFKYYFFRVRRRKRIPEFLKKYCKKLINHSPKINFILIVLIFGLPNIHLLSRLDAAQIPPEARTMMKQFFLVSIFSSIPSCLWVYFWQKVRVQTKYIEHVFSKEELRIRLKRSRMNLKMLLLTSSAITSFLPLIIVCIYIAFNITEVEDLSALTKGEVVAMMGNYYKSIQLIGDGSFFEWFYSKGVVEIERMIYINFIDTIKMLIGIFAGILVTFAYIFFLVKWMNELITVPVDELVTSMGKLGKGEMDSYAIVRSDNELGVLTEGYNKMIDQIREREKLRHLFGQYLTTEVSEEILNGKVKLGGDLYEATILFADIRNFTSISEKISPQEVVAFLNEYFNYMIEAILKHNGIIDKFIGDGILAIFGVPIKRDDHADSGVRAAVEMHKSLKKMNKERESKGLFPLAIGIGMHSGSVIAGNLGNEKKLEYTVIGDTVNLASRIEELTKEYGSSLLISEETYKKLNNKDGFVKLQDVTIRGKSTVQTIYEYKE